MLLVVDNAEHLLPRSNGSDENPSAKGQPSLTALLRLLLYRLPHLTLLVTSRRVL